MKISLLAVLLFFTSEAFSQQTINNLVAKEFAVESTTKAAKPCPAMTEAQRDLIAAPTIGRCIYNTTALKLNVYNGSLWKAAGGGIENWVTAFSYAIGDVVIESNKIYQANTAHTSSALFVTDIANWDQLANDVSDSVGVLPLSNGGTNKNLTATAGRVVYSDADSFELTGAGTNGQVLQSNGSSAPSFVNPSINTEQLAEGVNLTTEKLEVYNNQLTSTGTNTYLIESKNTDILENSGFEATNADTNWTSGAGTLATETTVKIQGNQALKVTLSSQALSISQDSTLYASQFADGVQGLAFVRVKTTVANVYVCQRSAGVSQVNTAFSKCVAVNNDGKWGLYKIPVILGATSNGIEIASYNSSAVSVAVTGDVYIDDAFVGATSVTQEVDASRIAGESYFAGTTNCQWTRTSTTVGAFTTDADCPGPTIVRSSLGQWQTTDSDLPRQTINNLPSGTYKATFTVAQGLGATARAALAINDGTTTCEPVEGEQTTALNSTTVSCTFSYASSGNRVFEIYGASSSGQNIVYNELTSPRAGTKFILEYFSNDKVYTASCGANCVDTFSAKVSAAGVVSGENVDWINGNASIASTSTYTMTFNSNIFTVAPNCTSVVESSVNFDATMPSISSTTAVTRIKNSNDGTAQALGFWIICQKQGADFTATRNIIGSFNEVVTSKGTSKPSLCSADFAVGSAITAQDGGCFASGSGTMPRTITFTSNYWASKPKCWADAVYGSSNPSSCVTDAETTSSVVVRCYNAGALSDPASLQVFCHGPIQ